jgi:hypothetical protein
MKMNCRCFDFLDKGIFYQGSGTKRCGRIVAECIFSQGEEMNLFILETQDQCDCIGE